MKTDKDVTDCQCCAARDWLRGLVRRLVRRLAEIMDSLPCGAKALIVVMLIVNGIKGLWALVTLLMWSIVYVAVKAI